MTSNANQLRSVAAAATMAHEAAVVARGLLAARLLDIFQRLMPEGTMVNRGYSQDAPPPEYIYNFKTLRGNDRGTNLFRIVKVVAVEADARYPELSTWIADAIPVSEKTGKDMKATARGIKLETVRLHGKVTVSHGPDEPLDLQRERLFALADAADALAPAATA